MAKVSPQKKSLWVPQPYSFTLHIIQVTLDKGPRDQWIQAILLIKSFKLVPRPLDKGPRPKSGKLIWRTKNQAREQDTVHFKDSICFMIPNWFLGNWTVALV
jgi:hypothetical protein